MKVVGLTGSFGTGKTFVASVFKACGARVLDADAIAHDAIKRGMPAYERIVASFGRNVLGKGRNIDRKKLAEVVFADKTDLARLDRIVHPIVIQFIKDRIKNARPCDIIVVDAPLLVEAKVLDIIDKLVVVKTSKTNQIKRCMKKFRITKEDVLKRIKSQISMEHKIKMADFVVDNDGIRSETKRQVKTIWRKIYGDC